MKLQKQVLKSGGSSGGNFWHQACFLHSHLTHPPIRHCAVIKCHIIIFTIAFLLIIHRSCMTSSAMASASILTPPTGITSARAGDNTRKVQVLQVTLISLGLSYYHVLEHRRSNRHKLLGAWRSLDSFFHPLSCPFHAKDSRPAAEVVSEYAWWVHRLDYTCMLTMTVSLWPSAG